MTASVRLKWKLQHINTVTFYFAWYFDAVSRCPFQTYRSNIKVVNMQMLISRHTCFAMASLIAQGTSKIVNVSQQRCSCISFHEVTSITFYMRFTALHFDLWISSDPLIFLLLYLASLDVFGFSQLNWPWHFKQCSVAPELSHFPFMLSCWCSTVLVITFFFVSPMYCALQLQLNV